MLTQFEKFRCALFVFCSLEPRDCELSSTDRQSVNLHKLYLVAARKFCIEMQTGNWYVWPAAAASAENDIVRHMHVIVLCVHVVVGRKQSFVVKSLNCVQNVVYVY